MNTEDKINIDVFKVVTRAIAESDDLGVMANNLTQLLTGTLAIKGCTIFALNPDTKELEVLASFGLSLDYLNKGPILVNEKASRLLEGEPIVIRDVEKSDDLQYPENAKEEGIGAMVSLPINFCGEVIGALRLYHHEPWSVSAQDLDSLNVLGENIGLAMMYTRLLNTMQAITEAITELPATLNPRVSS
jgi:transcriptional regulator with GAF, ATPase, and Fis domain